MPFSEALAARVRGVVADRRDVAERRMFGGLAFLVDGKMFCGVLGDDLVVRVGAAGHADALARPHVRPMDFTGRPMRGFVYVAPEGTARPADLAAWVERGLAAAQEAPAAASRKRS